MSKLAFALFSLSVATHSIASPARTYKLADLLESPNWNCDYTHRSNLAHDSDGLPAATVATIAQVKCVGRKAESGITAVFNLACLASEKEALPDIKECLLTSQRDTGKFTWVDGSIAPSAIKKSATDKYGRKCVYNTPDRKARIAYRIFSNDSYDATCATPIACDNYQKGPKHWIVACKANQVPQKDGSMEEFCPQPVDCVEKELPLFEPHATAKLSDFSKSIASAPKQNRTSRTKSQDNRS